MKAKEFVDNLDEARVVAAIAAAERKSSGEIRVYVSHRTRDDALEAAKARFNKLGMQKTRHRNGVLLYFAPMSRKFAVWGDKGVHEKCGEQFWKDIAEQMVPLLKEGRFTEAVEQAVKEVGEVLASHFPPEPDDRNELPDSIIRD